MRDELKKADVEIRRNDEGILYGRPYDTAECDLLLLECVKALLEEVEKIKAQVQFLNPGWRG
jgi:hypothetical protein